MAGLIVAGFHRSGTSSVTQALAKCGIQAGDELMDGNEFNQHGHFEDWPVVRFHDSVLERCGLDWATPLEAPIELTDQEAGWIEAYIREREAKEDLWALKDPRICRFVEHWRSSADNVRFLIVYRNPIESVHSLNRRENINIVRSLGKDRRAQYFLDKPDLALRLWIEHNAALLKFARVHARECIVIGHHHYLAGFDVFSAISDLLGGRRISAPEAGTIDERAISKKHPHLYVNDADLIPDALDIWRSLQQIDVACAEGALGMDISSSLHHDPTGEISSAFLASYQVSELHKITELNEENAKLIKDTKSIIKKISEFPFSIYFKNKDKYAKVMQRYDLE
ncbi:MAG: hypothetical protein AAGE80_14450 [Pseudomonadota bacterium]